MIETLKNTFKLLNYQSSGTKTTIGVFSIGYSRASFDLPIDTLIEEIKVVLTEKNEFEYGDESKSQNRQHYQNSDAWKKMIFFYFYFDPPATSVKFLTDTLTDEVKLVVLEKYYFEKFDELMLLVLFGTFEL